MLKISEKISGIIQCSVLLLLYNVVTIMVLYKYFDGTRDIIELAKCSIWIVSFISLVNYLEYILNRRLLEKTARRELTDIIRKISTEELQKRIKNDEC